MSCRGACLGGCQSRSAAPAIHDLKRGDDPWRTSQGEYLKNRPSPELTRIMAMKSTENLRRPTPRWKSLPRWPSASHPCGLDAAVGVVGGDYSGSDHKAGVVDVAGKRVLIDHRKLQRESVQAAHTRPDAFGKSIYAYGVFACLDEAVVGGGAVVAPCVAEADAEGSVAVVVSDAGK